MTTKQQVFVAIYEHPHGSDVRVFFTEARADAWRAGIAEDWWDREMNIPRPDDPDEMASLYFDRMGEWGEFFSIRQAEIEE